MYNYLLIVYQKTLFKSKLRNQVSLNKNLNALVMGGYGDAMVPQPRYMTTDGVPFSQFLDQPTMKELCKELENVMVRLLTG